jgi:hypothetical protein
MSYNVLAMDEYKKVNETSQGMGKAVSMFKATMAALEKAKPVTLLIPSNYQDNFNNKYTDITKLMTKAISDNKSIYFERETPVD